jgi:hypothetical protein
VREKVFLHSRCRHGAGSAHLQDLWLRRYPGHDGKPVSAGA